MNCTFAKAIYYNPKNQFCVYEYHTSDVNLPPQARSRRTSRGKEIGFHAIGTNLPTDGGQIELSGEWVEGKYGWQFAVKKASRTSPLTQQAIYGYLVSGFIKGMDYKLARRIIDQYGLDTFEVIESHPTELLSIKGMTFKKLKAIQESFHKNRELREFIEFLSSYGIQVKQAIKIYQELSPHAMKVIQGQPYILCDYASVRFETADAIARDLHFDMQCEHRIEVAAQQVLLEAEKKGHLYLPEEDFFQECIQLLAKSAKENGIAACDTQSALKQLEQNYRFVHWNKRYYLSKNYLAESDSAKKIAQILFSAAPQVEISTLLSTVQKELNLTASEKQKEAVKMVFQNNLSVITGGPGVGKTTALRLILTIYRRLFPDGKVKLAAPTGRASRRMEASAEGFSAQTLHSVLGLISDDYDFKKDSTTMEADFLIVDEMSMADMFLTRELFAQLRTGTKVLLIGDPDQLPSVGPGSVLKEMIRCGKVPVTVLEYIFRQSKKSRIPRNAYVINRGEHYLDYGPDFILDPCETVTEAAQSIKKWYLQEVEAEGIEQVQVLSPCKTFGGPISVTELNELLRKNLNPPSNQAFCKYGSKLFRVGDRVMQILNAEGVSNGEIGYILDACQDEKERSVTVSFPDGRTRTYLEENLSMLQLAYAMTIHKSLGSEYKTVILPVVPEYSFILSRKMLYTAVTRAAQKVILIGTEKAVHTAIDNTEKDERYTSLGEMIQNACKRWEHPPTLMEQLKISS